ncbi:MAG: DNA repair protein RecO [Faecalibacterium sp.]
MEPFVTTGLVLREIRYKESDRILTLLTPGMGVVSAMAQSSLRLKNKLFSACGLFCYSEFTLIPGRNMFTIREAEPKTVFHGLSASIEGMSLAMYLSEMAVALSPTGDEAEKELRLLLNCLYMISEKKADLRVVKAVFELRTMSECGFLPQLLCCKGCSAYDGQSFYLDVQEGYLLCADCAAKEGKTCNLDAGALFALRHICLVEDKRIFGFRISLGSLQKLSAAAERYALVHLDKPLKSYDFMKSVLP